MVLIEAAAAGRLELFSTQNAVPRRGEPTGRLQDVLRSKFVQQEMEWPSPLPDRGQAHVPGQRLGLRTAARNGRLNGSTAATTSLLFQASARER